MTTAHKKYNARMAEGAIVPDHGCFVAFKQDFYNRKQSVCLGTQPLFISDGRRIANFSLGIKLLFEQER